MNPAAQAIIERLELVPHPEEGGWFLETYRASDTLEPRSLPACYHAPRSLGTAIFYLLTPETMSHMHRLGSDEIFHFYAGDPCAMLMLHPDGSGENVLLGNDVLAWHTPQVVVPRNTWQGMRILPGGQFALMGCTVSPGFDYADYTHGSRSELLGLYPDFGEHIKLLTVE